MGKTFYINEDVIKRLDDLKSVPPEKFNANVRYFLHQLLDDPVHAEIPSCIKIAGISRSRFIKMLVDRGIVKRTERLNDTDKDGNHKTPTMSVKYTVIGKVPDELEYKVSKNDFDRKIEKLRRSIFEKNLPERRDDALNLKPASLNEDNGKVFSDEEKSLVDDFSKVLESISKEVSDPNTDMRVVDGKANFYIDKYGTLVAELQGGLNGSGDWEEYFSTFKTLCEKLKEKKIKIWLIEGENDCLDDKYIMSFGVKRMDEELNEDGCGATSADASGQFSQPLFGVQRRTFKVTEEQMRLFNEATATTSVGGAKTDYQYTVPFPVDNDDETMKRHNGDGGSVSINHVNESNRESLHTGNVGDYINDNPIGIHPEDPTMKRGEGKYGSHSVERVKSQNELNESEEDFLKKHDIKEVEPGLGYSEKEQKWYGWSHRAIHGFGIGDIPKECYPTGTKNGKKITTMAQAKEAARKFADSVS